MLSTPSPRSFAGVTFGTVLMKVIDDVPVSRPSNASSFYASLRQAVYGVMSLALCLQAVSQAPQHFISCETHAADVCSARKSVCSVISLAYSMSSTAALQVSLRGDAELCHMQA